MLREVGRVVLRCVSLELILLAGLLSLAGCGGYSPPPPPPNISISITPRRGGLTIGQSLNFTASVTNDMQYMGVNWSATAGSFSSQTATSAVYTAPMSAGAVTITATSKADGTKSATATISVTDLTGVFTWHNDPARTGQNVKEFALTPANVNSSTFGKLFSCTLDAAAYAQPLWVANLSIGGGTHNIVFAATVHNSVYAFDADTNASPCVPYWQKSLLGSGETWVSSSDVLSGDIHPDIGIIGTPVIDPATNTLYVVSKSKDTSSVFHQRLHALDLGTGNEKFSGPVEISASVPGTGDGSTGGTNSMVPFNALTQNQRPGLLLLNGVVYITWASHGDNNSYHGWVIGYSASTLAQVAVFNTTPNQVAGFSSSRGGIWMSGAAPAADSSGFLYFATGNGAFNGTDAYGDSIVKLGAPTSGTLPVADFFTPFNQSNLDGGDTDLGSGGVLILPDLTSGTHPHLLVQVGKEGKIYLADRSNLGKYCDPNPPSSCSSDTQIVQELPGAVGGMWASPAYWNGNLFFGGSGDAVKAFSFKSGSSGLLSTGPTSQSSLSFGFPGASPEVSSSGTMNGIVWAIDSSQYGPPAQPSPGPAVLHAYDATNLANELWYSSQGTGNTAGNAVKFTVPTVANGKVYVGTRTEIDVYGLLP